MSDSKLFKPSLTNGGVADGYALTVGFTTNWIPVSTFSNFSANIVFTGGTPVGTISLEQCNDQQSSRLNPVQPLLVNDDNSAGAIKVVTSNALVPAGNGLSTAFVNGAGTYFLNQFLISYGWLRIVYVPSSNSATQLDIFCHARATI